MRTFRWVFAIFWMAMMTGCSPGPEAEAQKRQGQEGPASVDVAIAKTVSLQPLLEYTGTTQPYRQVSLRTQIEGQLLRLLVDVGDPVVQGQVLAQLDDTVQTTNVIEAQAEVTALDAEVAQARAQVSDALRQVESERLALQQAQSDAERYDQLYKAGAIAQQQAEQARTTAGTAQQAFRSAQEVVRTRQQAVDAAQRRVRAQQAVVAREQERRSYSTLTAPMNGVVLERVSEPGNLAQAGSEILKLGDFSQVKVLVQISELELKTIRVGQSVQVKLDAFANERLQGQITRLSPVADPTARLVPVEVTLPNPGQRIGSGLLARVSFGSQTAPSVVVPEMALQPYQGRGSRSTGDRPGERAQSQGVRQTGTLFVVKGAGKEAKVLARTVALGQRRDGQVAVVRGLSPGDRFVTRSSKALKDGDPVRLSILSSPSS
ncbi:MAG: efflux RND transporter periplasmic adaptor subunit [Thermosynechococcaceae cyanobacterium]